MNVEPMPQYWSITRDGDPLARAIFDRHYSRHFYKDGRKPKLFVGPGEKMILVTACYDALFIWRKFRSMDMQTGVNCAVFRNESTLLSSMLIQQAVDMAWLRWPGERLYTYVAPKKIKSTNPGFCFKKAGFVLCGVTKQNKLLILERLP